MRSLLYSVNTNSQTLTAGATVDFGNIVHKRGCAINMSAGNIQLNSSGYYDVDANITFTAGATGTAVLSLLKNGMPIPGATETISTTETAQYTVDIPAIVRDKCCIDNYISCTISGIATTVTNAAIVVSEI